MKNLIAIFVLSVCSLVNFNVNAQDIYYTSKGTLQIVSLDGDSSANVTSSDVAIILNYETAHFVMRFEANSLRTGVDSLDHMLDSLEDITIRYKGHFDLDYIKTEKNRPQEFEVQGRLEIDGKDYGPVNGAGVIEHVAAGSYPCLLNLAFNIDTYDLEHDLELPFTFHKFRIELNQAILNKELGE